MKEIWNEIRVIFAAIGGLLGGFLGGLDGLLYALLAFAVADYLTGVANAVMNKTLSSEVGARGIVKKVMIFVLVGIAHITDVHLLRDYGSPLRTATIFFYLSNEGVSLLENAVWLGLPVPDKLRSILSQLRENDKGGNK